MKDINIKNIIAKMYSVILSFFFILILSLFLLFGWLLHGIKINNISFTQLKIQQLYIKWDKGLIVTANKLAIQKNTQIAPNYKSYTHDIFLVLRYLQQLSDIIKKVYIKDFTFNHTHLVINYNINQQSFINIDSPKWLLTSTLKTDKQQTVVHIEKLINHKKDIDISGNITVKHSNQSLNALLIAKLDSNTSLALTIKIKKNILTYGVSSKHNISNIQKILKQFPIPKNITPWIYNNTLHVKNITLNKLSGYFNLNSPNNAFQHIFLNIDFNQISYRFDKNLTSIIAPKTTLIIQDGIIKIYPEHATFLHQPLQKSWLYINPLGKNPTIGIYILGNFQLSKQLNSLLTYYNITIPFTQTDLKTKTYLQLILNLHNLHINAKGIFDVNDSLFNYHGHLIHINKASIVLNNKFINIKNLAITDGNNTKADISGKIYYKQQIAHITCKIDVLRYGLDKHNISLKAQPLILTYTQNLFHSHLDIAASTWTYRGQLISLGQASLPININTGKISIPQTMLNMNNKIKLYLSGHANMRTQTGRLNLNLVKFQYHSVKLNQINLPLQFYYHNSMILSTQHLSNWVIGDKSIAAGLISIKLTKNKIFVKPMKVSTDNNISAKISVVYDYTKKVGDAYIQKLLWHNKIFNKILHNKHSFSLKLTNKDNIINLSSQQFGTDVSLYPNSWVAHIDLSKLANFITPLKQYNLTNGYLNVSSKNNTLFLLHSIIHFPYPIIINHNKKIYKYDIKGSYNKQSRTTKLKINNNININIDKQIHITSPKAYVNVLALISFFKSHQFKSTNQAKSLYIALHNGYLYAGKNRKILFDNLNIIYVNSVVTSILTYKKAKANLKMRANGYFDLFGSKFDDNFMNHIFTTSQLSGGTLSFAVRGNLSDYKGLIEINDAVLKKYTILNNILAFINTVPALTSFSLPDYSTKGLPTQKMYCTFENKKNILTLEDIALKSKELNIYGKGKVDLKTRKLDIDLNLKTNIASALSKIPLVGYIIFNKNNVSTSLKITGTIDKPDIQTSIAKDIVLAPFNIIKRTFLSPLELVMPKKEFKSLFQ